MTVTLAEIYNQPIVPHSDGDAWDLRCGVVFSGAYKTGGDTTLATAIEAILKEVGSGNIQWVQISGIPGFIMTFNYETNKLMVTDTGSASGEPLKELAEAEYPATIRNAKARLFATGF